MILNGGSNLHSTYLVLNLLCHLFLQEYLLQCPIKHARVCHFEASLICWTQRPGSMSKSNLAIFALLQNKIWASRKKCNTHSKWGRMPNSVWSARSKVALQNSMTSPNNCRWLCGSCHLQRFYFGASKKVGWYQVSSH